MLVIMLGASLTFGAALFAAVIFTDGALLALRTAAQVIGWLFILATLAGVAGLRRASGGQVCAMSVALCSGLAALYMSYFLEWSELPRAANRHAVSEASSPKHIDLGASLNLASVQVPRPAERQPPVTMPAPRTATRTAALPAAPVAHPCSALTAVESLQCRRCADRTGLAWVTCREAVRLEYCNSEAGDEEICPTPFPLSHPG
jgi:hypothetical protein